MKHVHLTLLLALSLLLLCPAVQAEDAPAARRVAIPNAGLTVEVPAGWELAQYGPALLRLRKAGGTLWFYAAEAADETSARHLRRLAEQATADAPEGEAPKVKGWKVKGAPDAMQLWYRQDERARFHGVAPAKGGGFYAEADLPVGAKETRKAIERMLASVEATPYAHPERLVDWTLGFTIDAGGEDWSIKQEKDGRIRMSPAEAKGVLIVEQQGKTVADASAETRIAGLLDAMRRRLSQAGRDATIALDGEVTETTLGKDTKAASAPMRITIGETLAMKGHVYVAGRLAVSTAAGAGDEQGLAVVQKLAKTFRLGTHPGPQKAPKAAGTRFERADAPAVVFTLPEDWTLSKPRTRMHAGHINTGSLQVSAFFFGKGGGGTLEANLTRWKGQVKGDEEAKQETIQIAEGIEATVLDAIGTYASMRTSPHGQRGPQADAEQHLIAVYMACPGGPLFFKLVGERAEVAKVRPAFITWLKSFRVAQ